MTVVALRDWNYASRAWLLDVSSGQATAGAEGPFHGFLHAAPDSTESPGRLWAIYAADSLLWFQVDDKRWPFEAVEFSCELDRTGLSHFAARIGGDEVADAVYLGPAADPINQSDPSFDALDYELQDFFYFVTINGGSPSWRSGVLTTWTQGI